MGRIADVATSKNNRGKKSRPTKPKRRTKAEIEALREVIHNIVENGEPMTVRQVFYQLTSQGIVPKTEAQYKNTVVRLLGLMRRDGDLPFDWIADSTRWMRKPNTYGSMEYMLEQTARTYRRSIWNDQDVYVEIWLEKEALAGVLYHETERWDVPLMVTRGYPSLSYLYSAAEAIGSVGKPAYLYYFGDHDPSGVDIPRKVETDLREFAHGAEIHFQRVAVTAQQIEEWDLPGRPTKQTDTRSKNFTGDSVEVDAIKPAELRRLVSECITKHIDQDVLDGTLKIESLERESLEEIAAEWGGAA